MSAIKVLILCCAIFTCCHGYSPVIRPNTATFNTGSITGTILPGFRTPFIEAFLGVPFAEPPVGNLRFSDPVPFQNFWAQDHIANQEREMCIQKNYLDPTGISEIHGTEDCLYLNIFRPMGTSSDRLLPVIIKIHGGAFIVGSASTSMYGPKFFMDNENVILVTITYRVGPIGFLSTGDNEIPGNFAFKDQALAMQWVKENIWLFNGDPDQITIYGQSAGGASVHLHMLSPLSQNLFNRVIAASGSGIAPFAYVDHNPLGLTRLLAREMGIVNYDTMSTAELAVAFRAADAITILNAGDYFRPWQSDPTVVFQAVVESGDNPNAFLIEDPRVSVATGNYKIAPLLMSIVPEEGVVKSGMILVNDDQVASLNENFDLVMGLQNSIAQNDPQHYSKISRIVDFYFNGTRNIGWHNAQQYTNMLSDRIFHYPYYSTYKFHSKTSNAENPVYLMEFNYRGPFSFSYIMTLSDVDFGVVHGDEILYLFDNVVFPPYGLNSVQANLAADMVNIYVNFASGRLPHEKATPCTFVETDPDKPCDFLYIANSEDGNGYDIQTRSGFNMDMVNFWRTIDPLF